MRLSPLIACAALAACGPDPQPPPTDAGMDARTVARPDVLRPEVAPGPAVLAAGLAGPHGLVRVGGELFVAERGRGRVVRVSLAGGEPATVAEGLGEPYMLAADGTALFVTDRAGGRVVRVSLRGEVAVLASGQARPGRVQTIDGVVYWLDEGAADGAGALRAVGRDGGEVRELAAGLRTPHDLAVTHAEAFFTETGAPDRLAVVPLAGAAPPRTVARTYVPAIGLAVDEAAGEIYWTTRDRNWPNAGMVYRSALDGGALQMLSDQPPHSDRVALTPLEVYWAASSTISRVPRRGGAYSNAAIETAVADFVVTDDGALYWTDPVRGQLLARR